MSFDKVGDMHSIDNLLTRSNLIDSKASTKGKICAQVKQEINKHAASIMLIIKQRQRPTQAKKLPSVGSVLQYDILAFAIIH